MAKMGEWRCCLGPHLQKRIGASWWCSTSPTCTSTSSMPPAARRSAPLRPAVAKVGHHQAPPGLLSLPDVLPAQLHHGSHSGSNAPSSPLPPPTCNAAPAASDPSVAIKTQASMAGEYKCDTRPQLLQSALEAVQAMRPDMVLWTGDTAPHHPSTTQEVPAPPPVPLLVLPHPFRHGGIHGLSKLLPSGQDVVDSLSFVVRELVKALPGVPVFPSLGNYDFVPVHSDPGPPLNQWLLAPAASLFGAWLGEDALSTFRYAGYYEVAAPPPASPCYPGHTSAAAAPFRATPTGHLDVSDLAKCSVTPFYI